MGKFVFFMILIYSFSFSMSFAACKIDEMGVVTGAACSIPKNEVIEKQESQNGKNVNKDFQKDKEKKKRMNFKFDRSLLYRNVNVIWFN